MEIFDFLNLDWRLAVPVILNLILIESLLSIDNAAVLATMVMGLPEHQRGKALSYGILGAYVFRGICLVFAAILYKIVWLKAIGGVYLLWLAVGHFKDILKYKNRGYELFQVLTIAAFVIFDPYWDTPVMIIKALLGIYAASLVVAMFGRKHQRIDGTPVHDADLSSNPLYKFTVKYIGQFWATVILIELMDLAFSLDNVFAAVAFTDNLTLICIGVFIGILAMRIAAQGFVELMKRFNFLEELAYIVIAILGLKLFISYSCDLAHDSSICHTLESHGFDLAVSLTTICVFVIPVLFVVIRDKFLKSAK